MNKKILITRLKELVDKYKEKEEVKAIYLTSYLDKNYKILELHLLADNLGIEFGKFFNLEDNYKIVVSLISKKDLELREINEKNLVKLMNSSILYDKNETLIELQKKLIKLADELSLASINNELTFFEDEEITNKI